MADGYRVWKQQLRELYSKSTGGNEHLADHLWCLDVLDTDFKKGIGFVKTAVAAYNGPIPKDREDVVRLKQFCRTVHGYCAGLGMSDLLRYRIESVFNAVEELSELQDE